MQVLNFFIFHLLNPNLNVFIQISRITLILTFTTYLFFFSVRVDELSASFSSLIAYHVPTVNAQELGRRIRALNLSDLHSQTINSTPLEMIITERPKDLLEDLRKTIGIDAEQKQKRAISREEQRIISSQQDMNLSELSSNLGPSHNPVEISEQRRAPLAMIELEEAAEALTALMGGIMEDNSIKDRSLNRRKSSMSSSLHNLNSIDGNDDVIMGHHDEDEGDDIDGKHHGDGINDDNEIEGLDVSLAHTGDVKDIHNKETFKKVRNSFSFFIFSFSCDLSNFIGFSFYTSFLFRLILAKIVFISSSKTSRWCYSCHCRRFFRFYQTKHKCLKVQHITISFLCTIHNSLADSN